MKNHLGIVVGITMLVAAGVVYSTTMDGGVFQGSLTTIETFDTPTDACGGTCESHGLCCDGVGECTTCASSSFSSSSSSKDYQKWCEEVCGEVGKCCDKLIGGGFPTCKQCDSCKTINDGNASFCCSQNGVTNNRQACCAYNPNFCVSSSSSLSYSSRKSSIISCSSKTNSKAAWGTSGIHTYTDSDGTKGRDDAYKNAGADALVQANNTCAQLTVGVCDKGCSTVPPLEGPTFTPGKRGTVCDEQMVQPGVHAVICRVDGTCSVTRNCSVNY